MMMTIFFLEQIYMSFRYFLYITPFLLHEEEVMGGGGCRGETKMTELKAHFLELGVAAGRNFYSILFLGLDVSNYHHHHLYSYSFFFVPVVVVAKKFLNTNYNIDTYICIHI